MTKAKHIANIIELLQKIGLDSAHTIVVWRQLDAEGTEYNESAYITTGNKMVAVYNGTIAPIGKY